MSKMCDTSPNQLASVTARNGADMRNQENSEVTAVTDGEAIRLGMGDQVRVGQTAALYDYMIPPIQSVDRFDTWARYKRNADLYANLKSEYAYYSDIKVGEDAYIAECCAAISPSEVFLNIHREFYNGAVTNLRRTIAKAKQNMEKYMDNENCQYELRNIKRANELCAHYLNQYNKELELQNKAAKLIQHLFKMKMAIPNDVRISDTGTWIADDEEDEEDQEDTCQGCRENQPNQLAHMHSGGCLEGYDEEPFIPCSNVNCDCNAYNSIYFGYCSSECRYS